MNSAAKMILSRYCSATNILNKCARLSISPSPRTYLTQCRSSKNGLFETTLVSKNPQLVLSASYGKKGEHKDDDKKKSPPKVVVDLDAGSDDAIALLMLLAAHKRCDIDLKAITCVGGNARLDNVVVNTMRVLEATGQTDIPVYKGCKEALIPAKVENPEEEGWHGKDGFGDVKHKTQPNMCRLKEEHAVIALNQLACKHAGELTMIFLGPLTNVAICMKMFPKFVKRVKQFYVMGGNWMGVGNISNAAEFNFGMDPESAHIFFSNVLNQVVILPWETCFNSKLTAKWRMETMGKIDNPYMKLMNAVEASIFKMHPHVAYEACDPSCVACMLNPKVIKKFVDIHIGIELNGKLTRGQMVLDHTRSMKDSCKPNVKIVTALNTEIFKKMLMFAAGHKNAGY